MAKNLTLANVLRLLGAIGGASVAGGFGGVGGGIGRGGFVGGGEIIPFGEGDNDVATSYPTTRMSVILNDAENNATIQRATAQKAAKMQELGEHNAPSRSSCDPDRASPSASRPSARARKRKRRCGPSGLTTSRA